ncbi:MAG: site-2 protease family protein [Candidatus Nanohalarchaeota archaeon]|nr:MAG: site-2 protease family protein [Candidatus Nanohaloarchaeota archaeon]
MNFSFSRQEVKELAISAAALGFIFSIGPGLTLFNIAMITAIISLSFIPHELAHKYVAMKYGCFARYQMWKSGLMFALFLAIVTGGGFVFAAPGAVMIYTAFRDGHGVRQITLTAKQNAFISAAGPAMNIMIALLFLPIANQNIFYSTIVYINSFLALFNLLPFPPLDGSKIIWYNFLMWGIMVGASFFLFSTV